MAEFAYSYEELINRSEEIDFFAKNFDKHLMNLSDLGKNLSRNITSNQAEEAIKRLKTVNTKSSEIQLALVNFATTIREEIAPAYENIQDAAREKTRSIYG